MKNVTEILGITLCLIVVCLTLMAGKFDQHGYELPIGWNKPVAAQDTALLGVCDRDMVTHGFPLSEQRPYVDSCFNSTNTIATLLNNAIYIMGYFGAAALIIGSILFTRDVFVRGRHE